MAKTATVAFKCQTPLLLPLRKGIVDDLDTDIVQKRHNIQTPGMFIEKIKRKVMLHHISTVAR